MRKRNPWPAEAIAFSVITDPRQIGPDSATAAANPGGATDSAQIGIHVPNNGGQRHRPERGIERDDPVEIP